MLKRQREIEEFLSQWPQPKTVEEEMRNHKALLDSGLLTEEEAEYSRELVRMVESFDAGKREDANYLAHHLWAGDDGTVWLVIKAHLLVEQRIWEFVRSRMLNLDAKEDERLTTSQVIWLAESLSLKTNESEAVWRLARKLNYIRNKIAHNLT